MPIGTILPYTGLLADIPSGWHLCDGTNGTPNLTGQFLQGSNSPGNFIEAGLPNLKGEVGPWGAPWIEHSGVFTYKGFGGQYISSSAGGGSTIKGIFNASNYNAIYKDDCNTVQPPAYTVYYIIKMA